MRLRDLLQTWTTSVRGAVGHRDPLPPELAVQRLGGLAQWQQHLQASAGELARQLRYERGLLTGPEVFKVRGYCYPCRRFTRLRVDHGHAATVDGRRVPNWRERLVCRCGLNSRLRASLHLFEQLCRPRPDASIYLTEQVTAFYRVLSRRFPRVTGSEWLGSACPLGKTNGDGVRNEDLCALSFPDAAFDYVLSFDVLEHLPDYRRGFQECLRCLKPGGALVFSVPFVADSGPCLQRARLRDDGSVEHLLPPEVHGNPIDSRGCLCYWHFGWDLLDELRAMGFGSAEAILYWSEVYGYLGKGQLLFLAERPR